MQTLDRVLTNLPIPVCMMGFESNTLTLSRHGWQFSIMHSIDSDSLDVLIKHESNELFRMYGKARYERSEMYDLLRGNTQFYKNTVINITCVSSDMMARIIPFRNTVNFSAWDVSTPELIQTQHINLSKFNPFRTFDSAKELVIDPGDVQKMMDLILKHQKPRQQEILRQQEKNERVNQLFADAKPKQELHLQLVSNF